MTLERYARSAILLHWVIALLLALEFGLGLRMVTVPQGGATFAAYQVHKSIGINILMLSLARLTLRLVRGVPPSVVGGAGGALAHIVHLLFYGVMIAVPLTGWAIVSTAPIAVPTRLFWLLPLPHLPIGRSWNTLAASSHQVIAWAGVVLVVLHVAGAVRHHLGTDPHEVMARMMPRAYLHLRPGRTRALGSAAAAFAVLLALFLVPRLLLTGRAAPATGPLSVPVAAASLASAPATPARPPVASPAPTATPTPGPTPTPPAKAPPRPVAVPWTVQPGGRLGFTARMNGAPIDGSMTRWSADIRFDPDALADSRIGVRIALLSAETGDESRDGMLRGDDFFASAGPEAVYRSDAIRRVGRDRYRADGSLTMNGRTLRVPLDFTLTIAGDLATTAGTARLDRVAFGIGRGEWAATDQIAADVAITFQFKALRAPQGGGR